MRPETKRRLEDFIERAEHIRNFSYFEGKDKIAGFKIREVENESQVNFYQPRDEQRDAVLLHLRLFIQDKDDISLRKLADLTDDPDISAKWKEDFEYIRKILNIRLDEVVAEGEKGN